MNRKPVNFELQAARFICHLENLIADMGITLECHRDFQELDRICNETPRKGELSQPFNPALVDITPAAGFWIIGKGADGETLHLQAIRCDEIEGLNLAQYWRQHFRRIYCDHAPPAKLRGDAAPMVSMIEGMVCYHGDVWVADHLRHKGLAGLLSRFALGLALLTWSPDYVYGFVGQELVLKGFHIHEGYMHQQPIAVAWETPPVGIEADDWLVWMSRRDLIYLTQQPQEARNRTARTKPDS